MFYVSARNPTVKSVVFGLLAAEGDVCRLLRAGDAEVCFGPNRLAASKAARAVFDSSRSSLVPTVACSDRRLFSVVLVPRYDHELEVMSMSEGVKTATLQEDTPKMEMYQDEQKQLLSSNGT